ARWARLEPARAGPWLTRQLDDKGDDVSHRCDAARALAVAGDRRGLDWLKEACLANIGLGGRPGAALLEAGDAGAAVYFPLVREHEAKPPGEELPYALAHASGCGRAALFKHLPRLLALKDPRARYEVRAAIGRQTLAAEELAFLIEHLRKHKYQDADL